MRTPILFILLMLATRMAFAQGNGPAIDPRLNAIKDNGSPHGLMMVGISQGEIVPVPFEELSHSDFPTGVGSAVSFLKGSGANMASSPSTANSDGSGTTMQVVAATTAAGGSSGVIIRTFFWGNFLGIRMVRNYSSTNDFGGFIDGVAFRVHQPLTYRDGTASAIGVFEDWDTYIPIASDLPDNPDGTPHLLELRFCQQFSGADEQWQIKGLLLSKLAGYSVKPRLNGMKDQYPLTTAFVGIMPSGSAARGIVSLWFNNIDSSAHLLSLNENGTNTFTRMLTASGTDASSVQIDFPSPGIAVNRASSGTLSIAAKADANSAVMCLPFFAQ